MSERDPILDPTLALWREEAARHGARVDPDALTSAVLAAASRHEADAPAHQAMRRYAVAALVLLGLGVAGSAALSFVPPPASGVPSLGSIEADRFALQGESEILSLPISHPKR